MWFHKKDLIFHPSIIDKSIRGYVLPHAGTTYTGKIISHTLRFKPTFKFTKVCIIYYPSSNTPTISNKHYHEYYVPMKSMKHFIDHKWKIKRRISYYGINLRETKLPAVDVSDTLIIVSADFSHFLPLQQSIELENKAAHALMFKQHTNSPYIKIVDDIISFKTLQSVIPSDWVLQWIGRSRSIDRSKKTHRRTQRGHTKNKEGVGYLSFLIKEPVNPSLEPPKGVFVTCYDTEMNARECLGEWFTDKHWSSTIETKLIKKVIHLGGKSSRLTGGQKTHLPIKYYTVTYLYQDHKKFIRGYHGIKYNAFYLPEVLLEHTFSNGSWIKGSDTEWKEGNFKINETLQSLTKKSGLSDTSGYYQLFRSEVFHSRI